MSPNAAPRFSPFARLPAHWTRFGRGLELFAVAGALLLWLAPAHGGLYLFALLMAPANSIIPIPHEPFVLLFAPFFAPPVLAATGCTGAMLAGFLDYKAVSGTFENTRIGKLRATRLYKLAVHYLMHWPWFTIMAFFAVPGLPVNVMRVLAPASGYRLEGYITALGAGRFIRFWIVAAIGHALQIPLWVIGAAFALFGGGALVSVAAYLFATRRRRHAAAELATAFAAERAEPPQPDGAGNHHQAAQ